MTNRAAIYARHSLDIQDTSSVDQVARCKKWCAEQHLSTHHVYVDEAISGAFIIDRPEVQRLLQDSEHDRFDIVVCEDLSRLSRHMGEIVKIYELLTFRNIKVISLIDGVVTKVHVGLRGIMNDLFRADLRDKTKRGQIATVLRGTVPLGKTYGYNKVKALDEDGELIRGKFEINENEAEIIRYIYDMHFKGALPTKIIETLEAQGVSSPSGERRWTYGTLLGRNAYSYGTLTQPLYIGKWYYNRTDRFKHPETGKVGYKLRSQSQWIEMELPELQIVETAIFEAVQKQLAERQQDRKKRQEYISNLPPELKAKRQNAAVVRSKRRARQRKPRTYSLFVFSRKLRCAHHGKTLAAIKGGTYSCSERQCMSKSIDWEPLTRSGLQAMKDVSEDSFITAAKELRSAKRQRDKSIVALSQQEQELIDRVAYLSQIIDIKTAASNSPTATAIKSLEDKALAIRQQVFELEEQPHIAVHAAQARSIRKRFLKAVNSLLANIEDQELTQRLNDCLIDLALEAWEDWQSNEIQLKSYVTLDFMRIFKEFQRQSS